MNDSIPDLKIELVNDGIGDGLILLEQDSCGNVDRVAIHPLHLRYMAEKLGLVETSDPQAQKTIAMLTRRLHVLRKRIDHLANWLVTHSDSKHADLSYEQDYAIATADIADEFCIELDGSMLSASEADTQQTDDGQKGSQINKESETKK
jgi:hypothetical protein